MKKLSYIIFAICCLMLALICPACNSVTEYTINVVNGQGGGTFEAGENVTLTATVPENQSFDYWAVDGVKVSNSNPYTFTAKKDATYTAVFKSTIAEIKVINGQGGGTFEIGTRVTISATIPQYKNFDYWTINGVLVSNSSTYTFTATEDATCTAVFRNQKADITVVNGQGSGSYDKGKNATITATSPTNHVFDYWALNGVKVSNANPYTFIVTQDATYTAVYKKTVASIQVTNGTGDGNYAIGSSITIVADTAPENMVFDYWKCGSTKISSLNPYMFNATEDMTFTAVYKKANRGVLRTNNTAIDIKPIDVNKGGTLTIDYKYVDPVADVDNSVSILLGSDSTNCYGKYVIFNNHLEESYKGVTFISLSDGYYRLIINISKLNEVYSGCVAPTVITKVLFGEFTATNGVYFDVTSEPIKEADAIRGNLLKNAGTSIYLSKTYSVSEGGILVLDYKYFDPVTDVNNGVSIYFGSNETTRFGNYNIFYNRMEKSYNGITFTQLDDGYYRITIDIARLDQVSSSYNAPTVISEISFRWFEAGQGVYFDVNPQNKIEKTTGFQMSGSNFVIANFTDIHVDDISLLSDDGTVGKTLKYAINNSHPDILVFSGDIAGSASDLNYICTYLDGFEIPYFVVLGNHDHEGSLGYDTIAQRVNQSAYGYIEKGPDGLGSEGNYTIKIKNSDGELVHALVLMDTGNKYTVTDDTLVEYVTNPVSGVKYGTYNNQKTYCSSGWNGLRGDQIDWYEETVQNLGCDTTLICHIPFLEFCKAYEQYQDAVNRHDESAIAECAPIGQCNMGEQICGSIENLGMFDAILSNGSTKNVICGHDHLNDFSLVYQGVRLTYAVKTGEGAYWKTDGTRCGYTELTIDSDGQTTLDQIYFNPLNN